MPVDELADILQQLFSLAPKQGVAKAMGMCDQCGQKVDTEDMEMVDGKMLCEDCAEDAVGKAAMMPCPKCKKMMPKQDMKMMDGKMMCPDCAKKMGMQDMGKSVEVDVLKVGSDEERTTTAVVYPAMPLDWTDSQGDRMEIPEIRKAAHLFMENSRKFDLQHKTEIDPGKVSIVESWLAPVDFDWPLPDGSTKHVNKGSWIATSKYHDDELWSMAKSQGLGAYSIRGRGKRRPLS